MTNFYEELNLNVNASVEEIKKQLSADYKKYQRRQSSASTPEKELEATKMLELVEEARKVFTDEKAKKKYDAKLKKAGIKVNTKEDNEYVEPVSPNLNKIDLLVKYYEAENYQQVIRLGQNLLDIGESDERIYIYMAWAYYISGSSKEAEKIAKSGISLYPGQGTFYKILACIYVYDYSNYASAYNYIIKAYEMLPNDYNVIKLYAFILMLEGKNDEADKLVAEAMNKFGTNIRPFLANAYLLYEECLYKYSADGIKYIENEESFEKITKCVDKAYAIEVNDNTRRAKEKNEKAAKKTLSKDNVLGLIAYVIIALGFASSASEAFSTSVGSGIVMTLLAVAAVAVVVYCAKESYLPNWKIDMLNATKKKTPAIILCKIGKVLLWIMGIVFVLLWKFIIFMLDTMLSDR